MGRAKTDNIGEKRFCPSRFGTRSILRHPSAIYFLATRPSNCVYSNDRRLVVENTSWKEMGNRVLRLVAEDPLVNIIYIYIASIRYFTSQEGVASFPTRLRNARRFEVWKDVNL